MTTVFSVVVVVGVIVAMGAVARWAYGDSGSGRKLWAGATAARRREVLGLREHDPNFSLVLFEEFLLALYVEAHRRRIDARRLARFSAFLTAPARATLATAPEAIEVKTVLVGELQIRELVVDADRAWISVDIEGAHVLRTRAGEQTWFSEETWALGRVLGAQSRPPSRVQVFACPNCGANLDLVVDAHCQHCDTVVDTGTHDWAVEKIEFKGWTQEAKQLILGRMSVGVMTPSDPALDAIRRLDAIRSRDPEVGLRSLHRRVETIFSALQEAWKDGDWQVARPYVTDRILEHELFWIQAHHERGERGAIIGQRLTTIDLIEVISDKWFDAVTFRIWSSQLMLGAGVEGRGIKAHSEYWTLIRGTAVAGSPADGECPSCNAPIDVVRSGNCSHCSTHVTLGEFDWILSRIEDPDAYLPS